MNALASPQSFERAEPPPRVGFAELAHLPGMTKSSFPLVDTLRFLADPLAAVTRNHRTYGPVYRVFSFGRWSVTLIGPEANELVMLDRARIFSSEQGWGPIFGRVFPRGLMLRDFDEHRLHRKALSVAFKSEPMRNYLGALTNGIRQSLASWDGMFRFYPAIKQLTLDLAATSFLGVAWGPEANKINQAFVDMIAATVAPIRVPLPGTLMARGVKGRQFMCAYFGREIPKRRGARGDDIFTQICNAADETGIPLSDQDIIDHMNFLMLAAHDTLTSSLTSTVYYLGKHPDWQEKLRAEVLALRAEVGPDLPYDRLGDLPLIEMAFKEAVRLVPPVPSMPRRALQSFTFKGYQIPAGAVVTVSPMMTHRLPDIWPDPEHFDPLRFTPENSKERHKYAWVGFGGGAHMCLGLHFAYMQAKAFFYELLAHHRIILDQDYVCDFQRLPIPRPKDGLPVRLERIKW